jgi:hypothetical protein
VFILNIVLSQGKLAIYELMSEESAVNFWEVRVLLPEKLSAGNDC